MNPDNNPFGSLDEFLSFLDERYQEKIATNALFDPAKTQHWSAEQRAFFCRVFYHLRGHFHDFLWLIGNYAPTVDAKTVVLNNIREEFGQPRSHEQLYGDFAHALGVNLAQEMLSEAHYLTFAREFNRGHLRWLMNHSWHEKFSAFAAYERLDNVDYPKLLALAQSFCVGKEALLFFKVHTKVEHYGATQALLQGIWAEDAHSVVSGFTFIYDHQIKMWQGLMEAVNAQGQAFVVLG